MADHDYTLSDEVMERIEQIGRQLCDDAMKHLDSMDVAKVEPEHVDAAYKYACWEYLEPVQ